jgi:hypothetical protein
VSQLSRPYQIALVAIAVFGVVWVMALRGKGSGPSEPAPSRPSAPATTSTPSASTPTHIYHGPAPGVEGLTRDIAKAHEAVGASGKQAKRFEHASAESPNAPASASNAQTGSAHAGAPSAPVRTVSTGSAPTPANAGSAARPPQQVAVEGALMRRKTVLLVFWNPKSSVDAKVRAEADGVARGSKGRVVTFDAQPTQVGLFGPVTEVSHVYETPTVLIVNGHGVVSTITGLTDSFSLKAAVSEAEKANA